MRDRTPIELTAITVELGRPEFDAICGWPFADPFVARILRNDIPQRVLFNDARVWTYRDPDDRLVGFGALDVCEDYCEHTAGRPHPYIPLLAVNPTIKSLGYGTSIVRHLIGEAALLARRGTCHDVLYLDVYATSVRAIELYGRCGFVKLSDEPLWDGHQGGAPYFIMNRRVTTPR